MEGGGKYIFYQIVNPRMLKIRDCLNALCLLSEEILRHCTPRIVYGVNLVINVTDNIPGISVEGNWRQEELLRGSLGPCPLLFGSLFTTYRDSGRLLHAGILGAGSI